MATLGLVGEAAPPPRQEQIDPVLAQQPRPPKQPSTLWRNSSSAEPSSTYGTGPGPQTLLLTGRCRQELLHRFRRGPGQLAQQLPVVAGMDDLLGKPLDGEQVRAVLSRWAGARSPE